MSLVELAQPEAEPVPTVVAICRNLLERAESGELRAVAICGVLRAGPAAFASIRSYYVQQEHMPRITQSLAVQHLEQLHRVLDDSEAVDIPGDEP